MQKKRVKQDNVVERVPLKPQMKESKLWLNQTDGKTAKEWAEENRAEDNLKTDS